MSELKVGDKVYTGPYEIVQFRDTHRPGPQDTGDTVILARGDHGAMGADTSLTIPAPDNLAAVAKVLSAHPETGKVLKSVMAYLEHQSYWSMATELKALDKLAAALNGGAS